MTHSMAGGLFFGFGLAAWPDSLSCDYRYYKSADNGR